MSDTFRCASCGDGPFKTEVFDPHPTDKHVVGGYWFCEWCRKGTPEKELVERAEGKDGVPKMFSDKEMEAEAAEWENPEERLTD